MKQKRDESQNISMKKTLLVPTLLIILNSAIFSQEEKPKSFELNGYLTTMQSAMFDSISGPVSYDNIIHNRLNFKAYAGKNITFATEIRNRLFTGDMARIGKSYSEMIGTDRGWADMSWNILTEKSFFLNTTIDRLWVDFNYGKLQVRAGRQRINWGQTLVWNPNDIFNAYSFFDFDYIERPGSDAIRVQYYPGSSSAVEAAVKMNSVNKITAAGLLRFNKWGYDIQFLGGYSNGSDIIAGAGWSGSIGSLSFRGEGSWFHPADRFSDTTGTAIITAGLEKIFSDNSIAQLQLMYCNNPLKLNNFNSFYSGNLSAKDLAFSKFTAFGQFTWATTPLLNTGISAMWFPGLKGYYAGPSLDYSLGDNLDFSLIWQHFRSLIGGSATNINIAFLRIKLSF
jgi:hypothetical protein